MHKRVCVCVCVRYCVSSGVCVSDRNEGREISSCATPPTLTPESSSTTVCVRERRYSRVKEDKDGGGTW